MKKFIFNLILFLTVFVSNEIKGQYCGAATTNVSITITTTVQNTASYNSGRRAFNFNATAGCTYTFATCGLSTADTYLRLYSTNVGGTLLASSDDACGVQSQIVWTCPTTGVYSILLTNWSCAALNVATQMSYVMSCAPPYNPCATIPTISCGTLINLNVASGSGIYNPPTTSCGFSTPGKEYLYSFTPTVTGNYVIQQPTSFGYIDWFYKLASGGCSGTGWTCIDDITNGNIGNANVNISLTAGTTYYIMADPESTPGGLVSFSITCPSTLVVTPANDNCSNAFNIVSLPFTSSVTSTNNSTDDVPTSLSSCGTMGSNLWYTVTGNGNTYTATTCDASTNYDTEVRVYTGSCASFNSMVEVTCNDDDGLCPSGTLKSTVNWCTQAGVVYYISVGYFAAGPNFGNFVLNVTSGAPCQLLPIELVSFNGVNKKEYNNLTWVTATEQNNSYFTLERSVDALDWDIVITKQGSGTVSTPTFYEYNDSNYEKGKINYYRLSQTDFDGTKKYFNIIAIQSKLDYKCELYQYYDLLGKEINFETAPSGIYLRKCGDKIEKVIK